MIEYKTVISKGTENKSVSTSVGIIHAYVEEGWAVYAFWKIAFVQVITFVRTIPE